MNDLRQRLRASDPLAHEPEMGADAADRVWRTVLAAQAASAPPARRWPIALAAAAVVCVAISGIAFVRRAAPARVAESQVGSVSRVPGPEAPRQLQFATRGGTRVIWTFNEDFEVR